MSELMVKGLVALGKEIRAVKSFNYGRLTSRGNQSGILNKSCCFVNLNGGGYLLWQAVIGFVLK
jgi:hypothetical protein